MRNFLLSAVVFTLSAGLNAAECFTSRQQQFVYEKGIASAKENAAITSCLLKELKSADFERFDKAAASLRKSSNTLAAMPVMMQIFKETKNPLAAFTAAAFMISAPYELVEFEKHLLNILASQAPDYKKALAVTALASIEAVDAAYTPFLTPAINAEDIVMQAYAAAAYTIISPDAGGQYIDKIITLYAFDKDFAQTAFIATGLKDKALHAALKKALSAPSSPVNRTAAIEWIADTGDKKLLTALLEADFDTQDTAAISAAAQALANNLPLMRENIKKAFKKSPSSAQATVAVMAYTLLGGAGLEDIENFLKTGSPNEAANALRVISSLAGVLAEDASYYPNPELEKQKIKKLIPLTAQIADSPKSEQIKIYGNNALKSLYRLLNN